MLQGPAKTASNGAAGDGASWNRKVGPMRIRELFSKRDRQGRAAPGEAGPALEYVHHRERLRAGNRVEPLVGGGETFRAMLDAIAGAKRLVHLETYILEDGEVGERFKAALIDAARRGLSVRVLYDAVGSYELPNAFTDELEAAGVRTAEFHPIAPWRARTGFNQRDHMKILIADGDVGFTGGINIGDDYAPLEEGGGGWFDMHARVRGPLVADLARLFARSWHRATGERLPPPLESDEPAPRPHVPAAVIDNFGIANRSRKRAAYLHAIRAARSSISLMNAYFIPDIGLRRALRAAVRRGVHVQVIVPGVTDVGVVMNASRYLYPRLLRAGVRIHEWPDRMMHAKTGVIDCVWSTIGSYNIDRRSMFHNLEASIVVADRELGVRMQRIFEEERAKSREVTLQECLARPWPQRAKQWLCYLFRYWL